MNTLQDTSIQFVKGVGPARAKLLANLGVHTIEDLLYLFPNRYEDRRTIMPIAQVQVGEYQTIMGKVKKFGSRKSWYTKKHMTEITLDDGGGRLVCVWFNQPYLDRYFKEGKRVVCYGKVDLYKDRLQMVSPDYEVIESEADEHLSLKRIVPVYPLTRGITQRYLRKVMRSCLDTYSQRLEDELPNEVRLRLKLADIKESIDSIHFPENLEDQEEALKRISFEEFFFFQISIILRRLSITQKQGIVHKMSDSATLRYIDSFPFPLTRAQKRVIGEIQKDMKRPVPMLRLLQGDVGSGKTIVAIYGCYVAFKNKKQAAIMAPTEILARQHYYNIKKLIADGVLEGLRVVLLVSPMKKVERIQLLKEIAEGQVDLVVGTHALITGDVEFKNLSFVVIDEQHKFGVRQRALLTEKGGNVDVLIMTATPIPRTLCITLYGDLDVSIIDEIPPGRGEVQTMQFSHDNAEQAYELIRQKVKEGRQAYIVYPIIEESEKLDLKAARDMYDGLRQTIFKDFRVGLLHGRLKTAETQEIMKAFKERQIDILVATTVLEVGVDVPNSSVMAIEHAERFGLAQLHQLRGRIGRGEHDAMCLLITAPLVADGVKWINKKGTKKESRLETVRKKTPQVLDSIKRMDAILSTTDGFKIAQHDLEIRGPGKYFGRHQHGLNELRVANPATQLDLLELARKEAIALTSEDPQLSKKSNQAIRKVVAKRYPTYLSMVSAG